MGASVDVRANAFEILALGLNPEEKALIASILPTAKLTELIPNEDAILGYQGELPALILYSHAPEGLPPIEIAQLLGMQFLNVPAFFLASTEKRYDRKNLIKNGFTDVFFLPMEKNVMASVLSWRVKKFAPADRVYRNVKIVDLQPGAVLDFDTFIYLPANNRHVRYSSKGTPLEAQKIERLKTNQINSLCIDEEDVGKFNQYVADTLRRLSDDEGLNATERGDRLRGSIREIITGLFSDAQPGTDGGKRMVEECQSLVRTYITNGNPGSIYDKILHLSLQEDDIYAHVANVSTFASLIAIGLGLKTVEEIALAGLLHDIGLALLPPHLQGKPKIERTPDEEEVYRKHPEYSISLIQEKKLILPDLVYKIILQHHERHDGTGYPKKLPGNRICLEAQILAFADELEERTRIRANQTRLTPLQAIEAIRQETFARPGVSQIDPTLSARIFALFPAPVSQQAS